jgi:hypothetical protein
MDKNGDWKNKCQSSVTGNRSLQGEIKMMRLLMGEKLADLSEACHHLPGKNFKEIVKEELDMSPASAYRYINVWEDLKWNRELVKNLQWSVLEKIANSDLPKDYKIDLYVYAKRGLNNSECDKIIKLWAEGKLNRKHPKWKALLQHIENVKDYHQRRDFEKNSIIPWVQSTRAALTRLPHRNLTTDTTGKERLNDIATKVEKMLIEIENILTTNSVEPSFNPQHK